MKTNFSLKSAVISGFIATAAMTMFTFMAPLMGFEMDIPKMLANTMGAPIIVGWMAHFMVGLVLAFVFIKIDGVPLPEVIKHSFGFFSSAKIYIWQKKEKIISKILKKEEEKEGGEEPPLKVSPESKLGKLGSKIEIGRF